MDACHAGHAGWSPHGQTLASDYRGNHHGRANDERFRSAGSSCHKAELITQCQLEYVPSLGGEKHKSEDEALSLC